MDGITPMSTIVSTLVRLSTGGRTSFSVIITSFCDAGLTGPFTNRIRVNALVGPAPAAPSFRCRFKSPAAGSLSPPIVIRKNDRSVCNCFALLTIESANPKTNVTDGFPAETLLQFSQDFGFGDLFEFVVQCCSENADIENSSRSATEAECTAMKASATSTNRASPSSSSKIAANIPAITRGSFWLHKC